MRLHNVVEGYITFKRKLGVRLCSEAGVLRAFCRSVGETEVADIKAGAVLAFIAGKGPVTRSWKQRASVLRSFYRYAISRGLCTNSPLPTNAPKFPPPRTPHIYSTDELNRLLEATVRLQTPRAPLRAFSYRMLCSFSTVPACGSVKHYHSRCAMSICSIACSPFGILSSSRLA